jgi:hypothetical protein
MSTPRQAITSTVKALYKDLDSIMPPKEENRQKNGEEAEKTHSVA